MDKKKLALIHARKGKIKRKPKKPPRWLFPSSIEREYFRSLKSLVTLLKTQIQTYLLPEIPSMIVETQLKTPRERGDDFLDRLSSIILFISSSIQNKEESTIREAESVGLQIAAFNDTQFNKLQNSAFGLTLYQDEPWLQDQLKLFSKQNAQLITKMTQEELERVSGIVERGLASGTRFTEIQKEIKESFGISERKARLIARDQTAKLNANLTELRQREIGVEEYVWATALDERVRPSHKLNEGKTFRWDKPPKTGHPGFEINCRCQAIAVMDKLLDLR
jgi:SPP1 gp7 family putative phage head morphogenesis protein